jgi:hypothetical protein
MAKYTKEGRTAASGILGYGILLVRVKLFG